MVDVLDQEFGEARILFLESLSDKHKDTFTTGKVYTISNLMVYSPYKGSRRQFTLDAVDSTIITCCSEDCSLIAPLPESILLEISKIGSSQGDLNFDIVLQVLNPGIKKARMKDGERLFVRDVRLRDSVGDVISLTLWNNMIDRFWFEKGTVVLCRSLRCRKGELRLVSTGDTEFVTKNIEEYQTLFAKKSAS